VSTYNENKKENSSKQIEVLIVSWRRIYFLLTLTEKYYVLFVILTSKIIKLSIYVDIMKL
jgi:hypothetical protein